MDVFKHSKNVPTLSGTLVVAAFAAYSAERCFFVLIPISYEIP
jgi:hypothetical protein